MHTISASLYIYAKYFRMDWVFFTFINLFVYLFGGMEV